MWRSIKAVSQLLVIAFSFWGAVTGALDPSVAFVGMIAAYLGAEGVETVLLAAGESTTNLSVEDADDRDREAEPDGGAVVAETPKRDPRHED